MLKIFVMELLKSNFCAPLFKHYLFFLFFPLLSFVVKGQNLISNGDFESYSSLPTNYGDFCLVTGWINPSGCCILNPNFGTPDYVNKNAAWPVGSPSNGFGTVTPRSGNGIVGFTTYANYGVPPVFREYLTKKLTTPLIIGQLYTVAFYLARAANPYFKYATNNLGVYFSITQPTQTGTDVITVTPNWEYTSVFSSTTWTLMTFNFVPTDTFSYITIGNFRSDAATTKSIINSSATGLYSHYFIDDLSIVSSIPLPVDLISFNASYNQKQVSLSWITASEHHSDYFSIERSADGITYEEIFRMASHHESNIIRHYATTDYFPYPNISYYRLKHTDFDGNYQYSKINSIIIPNQNNEIGCWYDNHKNKIIIRFPTSVSNLTTIQLINSAGEYLMNEELSDTPIFEIYSSRLKRGLYFLRINTDGNTLIKKVVLY